MNEPANPPAFPCVHDRHLQEGMTLRDYVAVKVLAELAPAMTEAVGKDVWTPEQAARMTALTALAYADAYLAERAPLTEAERRK